MYIMNIVYNEHCTTTFFLPLPVAEPPATWADPGIGKRPAGWGEPTVRPPPLFRGLFTPMVDFICWGTPSKLLVGGGAIIGISCISSSFSSGAVTRTSILFKDQFCFVRPAQLIGSRDLHISHLKAKDSIIWVHVVRVQTCPCLLGSRCSYKFLAFVFLFFLSDSLPSSFAFPLTWAPKLIVANVSALISSSFVFLRKHWWYSKVLDQQSSQS